MVMRNYLQQRKVSIDNNHKYFWNHRTSYMHLGKCIPQVHISYTPTPSYR